MQNQYDVFHTLERISKGLDEALKVIRSSEEDTKLKVKNWIVTWLLLPLHSLFDIKSLFKGIKKGQLKVSAGLPVLAGLSFGIGTSFSSDTEWYILLLLGILIGYVFSFIFLAPRRMCDFSSGYFRIGAYAFFRNQEYELFKRSILHENEFYFSAIHQQILLLLKSDESLELIHSRIDKFLNQEKVELASKVKQLEHQFEVKEQEFKQAIKDYDEEITHLLNANNEVHKVMTYIVDFIKTTRQAIQRKTNQKLNIADLVNMIDAGISIYKINVDHLELIADEGTSGNLPEIILFDDKDDSNLHYLAAAKIGESSDEPENDYFIISKRFDMKKDEKWVVSFHIDSGKEKALYLTLGNAILETREVYKMIHSLCLLRQEQLESQ